MLLSCSDAKCNPGKLVEGTVYEQGRKFGSQFGRVDDRNQKHIPNTIFHAPSHPMYFYPQNYTSYLASVGPKRPISGFYLPLDTPILDVTRALSVQLHQIQ